MTMKRICALIVPIVLSFFAGSAVAAADVEDAYLKAKTCAAEFKARPEKAAEHKAWERCGALLEDVAKKHPSSDRAPQALFSAGRLHIEAWRKFRTEGDVKEAIRIFNDLVRDYPQSTLADDALFLIGKLRHNPLKEDDRAKTAFAYIVENYPEGDMAAKAKAELKALGKASPSVAEGAPEAAEAGGEEKGAIAAAPPPSVEKTVPPPAADGAMAGPRLHAILQAIDVTAGEGETAIALWLSRRAAYTMEYIAAGLRTKSPPKLDLVLSYTDPGASLAKEIAVGSPELAKIRMKRSLLSGGVSLSFELGPETAYTVSSKGRQITVRFKRGGGKASPPPAAPPEPKGQQQKKRSVHAAQGAVPFVIVIDPGHGGSDTGAIGKNGTLEKDVTLALSKRLARELVATGDFKVFPTRSTDRTLSLEDRNAIAVRKKADLFVSIHANASTNRKMSGIETYYLNSASDAAAAKLARRENRSARKKLSDVEHILSTMLQNYDAAQSQVLAADVQKSLMTRMGKRYKGVQNRKVRSALFYVLVGAKCPAILVEASFLSNPLEEKRLRQEAYQKDLATSIAGGVRRYMNSADRRMVSL